MSLYDDPRWASFEAQSPGGPALLGRLLSVAALPAGAAVADIGCGRGAGAALLAQKGYAATGVDPSEALLSEARRAYPALAFLRGRAEALPFGDKALDGLLCQCTLSLTEKDAALKELHRVLRPGGRLLVADAFAPKGASEGPLPTAEGWRALFRAHGFRLLAESDETAPWKEFLLRAIWTFGSAKGLLPGGCPKGTGYGTAVLERPN